MLQVDQQQTHSPTVLSLFPVDQLQEFERFALDHRFGIRELLARLDKGGPLALFLFFRRDCRFMPGMATGRPSPADRPTDSRPPP
jgi:hypothetical protein